MAKLVQWWYDRNKLIRGGITWAVMFGLIKVILWYVTQNVSFSSMSAASTFHMVELVFSYLILAAGVVAFLGVLSQLFGKRTHKADGPMKMADGRYMIKK